jgi:NurA domain
MAEPFADLPDALVKDLLDGSEAVAEEVRVRIEGLRSRRDEYRTTARDRNLVRRQADLERPKEPSVAGIDGSYQLHRLTSLDLCGAAAVAVEGTSKEAVRHWPEPRHRMWTRAIPHDDSTTLIVRGLMICMELDLAAEAPHDVVLLDGSFSSLIIYLNQGLSNVANAPSELGDELRRRWQDGNSMSRLLDLLQSPRIAAAPKFTSRNELVSEGGLPTSDGIDGRTLATIVLQTGEYTTPLAVYGNDPQTYHLPGEHATDDQLQQLDRLMRDIRVVYYRPFGWVPALRIELPGTIASSENRLAIMLEGIRSQFFSPAVFEAYPLFLADRMVKSLGAGVAVVEQQVAQHVVENGIDVELTQLCLQNYRTEGGRGGV